MYAFTLERPATVEDASKLAASGSKVLAGGQTLLPSMKLRLSQPGAVADLGGIASLAGIRREGDAIVIGAMTRHMDVANSAEVKAAIPGLADLAAHIGDKQVRAMGTLGGSVANNDPAACYPSAVLALGATVHTTRRKIAADDFSRHVHHSVGRRRTHHRDQLPHSSAQRVHEVRPARIAFRAGGGLSGANGRRRARGSHRGRAGCVSPQGTGRRVEQELYGRVCRSGTH